MASISFSNITANSFSACVIDLDTNYQRSDRMVYWYLNGSLYTYNSLGAYVSTSATVNFSGLTPNTSYSVEATIYYKLTADSPTYEEKNLFGTCTTLVSLRPALFSWTYAKVQGSTFNLTAAEWNALTTNINLVRAYYGQVAYNFTTAYKGNNFLASMYNECLYAMNPMYLNMDLTTAAVSKGDTITASGLNYLVTLVNSL